MREEYQIGHGHDKRGMPVWVGYSPPARDSGECAEIYVQVNCGRHAEPTLKSPAEMLTFKNTTTSWGMNAGKPVFQGLAEEVGWFERICQDAKCEWFLPIVKRMANGEDVPLKEIKRAYLLRRWRPMPCGSWGRMFR